MTQSKSSCYIASFVTQTNTKLPQLLKDPMCVVILLFFKLGEKICTAVLHITLYTCITRSPISVSDATQTVYSLSFILKCH
jgi:hypothetical protein